MMRGSHSSLEPTMHMIGSSPELMTGHAAIQEQPEMAHALICLCQLMGHVSSTCMIHELGSEV